jgi:hypothetical protein
MAGIRPMDKRLPALSGGSLQCTLFVPRSQYVLEIKMQEKSGAEFILSQRQTVRTAKTTGFWSVLSARLMISFGFSCLISFEPRSFSERESGFSLPGAIRSHQPTIRLCQSIVSQHVTAS